MGQNVRACRIGRENLPNKQSELVCTKNQNYPLTNYSPSIGPPGPSLQGRTRFLNRDPGTQQSVQKIQPINLDQDPDQEVITTTKTEVVIPQYTSNDDEGE